MAKKTKRIRARDDSAQKSPKQLFPGIDAAVKRFLQRRWAVPAIFALLSILYFSKVIFFDNALLASDSAILGVPESGPGVVINPFAEGGLWHNTFMGGQPASQALHEYIRMVFYNLFLLLFSGFRSIVLYITILTFAAGFFMYLYIRSLGIGREISLLTGISYMFAPMFLSFTYAGHLSKMGVIALLPLMFTCLEKAFSTHRPRYFLFLGGAIALTVATAHLQFAYFSFWAVGFYFLYKAAVRFHETKSLGRLARDTGLFAFAVLLGLTIAARSFAPQYLHTTSVSKRAAVQSEQGAPAEAGRASTLEYASSWALHPEEVGSLLVPEFGGYFGTYWGRNYFKLNSEYFGFYPLFLFLAGLLFWRTERRVRFFTFLFFFTLLYALGPHTPFFKLCYYLVPGVKSFRGPSMISFLFSFSAMVVMALVLEKLLAHSRQNSPGTMYRHLNYLFSVLFVLGVLLMLIPRQVLSVWSRVFTLQEAWGRTAAQRMQVMMNNAPELSWGALLMLFFCGVLYFLFRGYRKRKIGLGILLITAGLVGLIDTWRIDRDFITTTRYSDAPPVYTPKNDAYERLKALDRTPYRVFPEKEFTGGQLRYLYPGLALAFGFSDFTLQRFDKVQSLFFSYLESNKTIFTPVLNLLNVKYYVAPAPRSAQFLQLKFSMNSLYFYENTSAFPYYALVHRYRVMENPDDVLRTVTQQEFDGGRQVILEKPPPAFADLPADSTAIASAEDSIQFLDSGDFYDDDQNVNSKSEFHFRVSLPLPGFFILSENYHPEWKATVDGTEQAIYRANYLWKGVFVPPGEHEVVFTFTPKEILYSRRASLAGLVVFFLLLGLTCVSSVKVKNEENRKNK